MRIVFILGNGFDLNLGLRTGYQDFYDFYLDQPSNDEDIFKMKEHLKKGRYSTWADLEVGLGAYTSSVQTVEQMRVAYYDLVDKLKEYLRGISSSFSTTDKMTTAIIFGLKAPQTFLPDGMKDAITAYKAGHYPDTINVISFNYTDTLEKILGSNLSKGYPITIAPNVSLESISHIHMRLDEEDVIMGVNDVSQISGKEILNDDLRALMVKPYINHQLQNLIDIKCLELINNAEIVCLFGVSLGETDLLWWRQLGERFLKTKLRIVLFTYDNGTITRNAERIMKYSKSKELLFRRMGIPNPTEEQRGRVFVGHKTNLFRI